VFNQMLESLQICLDTNGRIDWARWKRKIRGWFEIGGRLYVRIICCEPDVRTRRTRVGPHNGCVPLFSARNSLRARRD